MRRVCVLALVLAACGAPGVTPPSDAPASRTPLAAATATPPAAASPSRTASPTLVGPALATARADFDCDGLDDTVQFFDIAASLNPTKLARLVRSWGDVAELTFPGIEGGRSPLIGVADVNGDTCADAIVSVGTGASTVWTSFIVYDRDALRLVEEDGKAATFLYSGSVRHGNAIECRISKEGAEIVVRGISNYTSDDQWDVVEDVHRWATPSRLALFSTTKSVIRVSVPYAEPPNSARYWGLSCGGVKLPS